MRVLGLSGHFHDSAAALVVDGQIVAAAQEERFTRRKHDPSTPLRAAAFCLRQAGLNAGDLDAIVWHEKPLLKFERILLTSLATFPRGAATFRRAMISMVGDKMWVKNHLVRDLGVAPARVQFSSHHASHAASAYCCGPFERAAILCVDGVGEWATTSIWRGSPVGIEPIAELHFPHSLGLLYSVFTAFLGFEVNDGEYKVMGLSAFGEAKYVDDVDKVLRRQSDGSFELDMAYFCFDREADRSWTPAFEALFGVPRAVEGPMEQRHKDIAASIQRVAEEVLLGLCRLAFEKTGEANLCMAGGVALNAVAVGRIVREGPFDDVFVQPAAGDAGAALGAALLASGCPRAPLRHVALGGDVNVDATRRFLDDGGIAYEDAGDGIAGVVAERLARGEVVGWMQGRFEFGPRALGQRSILCDPRPADAKDRLNARIKFRESFRPFAPSVLAAASSRLFDRSPPPPGSIKTDVVGFDMPAGRMKTDVVGFDMPAGSWTRRFMTSTVAASDLGKRTIPAALHVDGTARVQEVYAEDLPLYADLLTRFGALTGVPCLVNTSFNLAGEPMVSTVADGYATFLRCGMDALAIGPFLITREPASHGDKGAK